MASTRGQWVLCTAVLLLAHRAFAAWPEDGDESPEAQLARWVIAKGGKVRGMHMERECDTCPRMVVASEDLNKGDLLFKVPFNAVLRLKDLPHAAYPAEHARFLLKAMHKDPAFNETWALYWATQPEQGETLTSEVFTDDELAMLQTPELESVVSYDRTVTEKVYRGSYEFQPYKPLFMTVPKENVSVDTFKHVASVLGSRYFSFFRDGMRKPASTHLVPLLDLVEHSDFPNSDHSDDGAYVMLHAIKPIKAGEEITLNYQPGVVHRPDMSLCIYGHVTERDPPLMAAVDLPTFDTDSPFSPTPLTDNMFYDGKKGKYVSGAEYQRLRSLLDMSPTSEEEDQERLDEEDYADWRERAILQYRVARKKALRHNLGKLAVALNITATETEGPGIGAGAAADLLMEEL